ncbi:hypothetical protein NIA71_06840 [Ihubacter massiliensis]|uniref:RNA polymerase alpha subunit C-terminal domain-containing protein n=1 Tax=Hominibacterium faecale TaxID=2839743 RepID=A0A9J6QW30_9FIRM|nr:MULTISPECIES: hypothetical protein [Eubacteriales Family XIII. Incertae Sedis]MCO7121665.1 hypothetical protein [Ihubacter massiliensis]MCU7378646.1 hypothetical protein [Hominibacterium faecale]
MSIIEILKEINCENSRNFYQLIFYYSFFSNVRLDGRAEADQVVSLFKEQIQRIAASCKDRAAEYFDQEEIEIIVDAGNVYPSRVIRNSVILQESSFITEIEDQYVLDAGTAKELRIKEVNETISLLKGKIGTLKTNSDSETDNFSDEGENYKEQSSREEQRLIDDAFADTAFGLFRTYCKNNGYKTLEDLHDFNFDRLINADGFGKTRIEKIKDKYENLLIEGGMIEESDTLQLPENLLVTDYFEQNSFAKFLDVCEAENLKNFRDLQTFDFFSLSEVKGFGDKKIFNVINKYENVLLKYHLETAQSMSVYRPFSKLHDSNKKLPIDTLKYLDVRRSAINSLIAAGCDTLESLSRLSARQCAEIIGVKNYRLLLNNVEPLETGISSIGEALLDHIAQSEGYGALLKRVYGDTFDMVAKEYQVTKQRVQQIESGFLSSLSDILYAVALEQKEPGTASYIHLEKILDVYDNDDYDMIFQYTLCKDKRIAYIEEAELFVLKEHEEDNIEERIMEILSEFVGEGINIIEESERLTEYLEENGLSYLSAEDAVAFLAARGFYRTGEHLTKKKSYGYLCAKLVHKYFPKGIAVYQPEQLALLKSYARKEYDLENVPDSDRAFGVQVMRNLVLWDRGVYISIEDVNYTPSLMEDIVQYLYEQEQNTFLFGEIFEQFKARLLLSTNIANPYALHGVLAYCYPNEFDYERDRLSKDIHRKESISKRIENLILSYGVPVNRNILKGQISGVTDAMILNAVMTNPHLTQWEHNVFYCVKNIYFDESVKKEIFETILFYHKEYGGYCNESLLYQALKDKYAVQFKENHINNAQNLFYAVSYLFADDFQFRRPHIAKKNKFKELHTFTIIRDFVCHQGIISRSEVLELCKKFDWPDPTQYIVLKEMEESFLRISEDLYCDKTHFPQHADEKRYILNILEKKLTDSWYLITSKCSQEIAAECNDETINPFLIESLVLYYGMECKIVKPLTKDRRYIKSVLVEKHRNIENYSHFVKTLLEEAGINEIRESELIQFLRNHGMPMKLLPKELYSSNYFRYEDGCFCI